jgi:Xaa-Pro aminopeptidase
VPANNGYPRTVIFHADAPMTVIEMGPTGAARDLKGQDLLNRGVGDLLNTPSFLSIAYTHEYDADLALAALKRRGYGTIGYVGKGALPHAFVARTEAGLPGATFIDATEAIDRIKAIKSPEEIALIERCAALQDEVLAAVLRSIRPGMRDIDVTALAQQEGLRLGSEQGIFLGGSSPVGVRSPFVPRSMQGRTLRQGDHLSLLIEINGPGGFYTEIGRTIVLGQASNELKDGFEAMRAAQDYSLSLLKPGASCRDIHLAHNDYMTHRGLPPELRLYAHGQGYDMVERPLIRSDETMTIEAGMSLAVHPGYETDSIFAVICDNYLIGPAGPGECLHKTPKQIFEVA